MDDMEFRRLVDSVSPTETQRVKMYEQIVTGKLKAKKKAQRRQMIPALAVACCLFLLIGGIGIDALTSGRLMNLFSKNSEINSGSGQKAIVTQMPDSTKNSWQDGGLAYEMCNECDFGYRTKISYCSEKYAIIAGVRGLLVIDKAKQSIYRAIDLQYYGYNFFDIDEIETIVRFNEKELKLVIYNEMGKEPIGEALIFQINPSSANEQLLSAEEKLSVSSKTFQKEIDKCADQQKETQIPMEGKIEKEDLANYSYSIKSCHWTNSKGEDIEAILFADASKDNPKMKIYEINNDTELDNTIDINIPVLTWNAMPDYNVSENDALLDKVNEVIIEKFSEDYIGNGNLPTVFVPYPIIYGIEKDGDMVKVFALLNMSQFEKSGTYFNEITATTSVGAIELKKSGNDYKFESMVIPSEGDNYIDSIKQICEGYEKYVNILANCDTERSNSREVLVNNVKKYIKQNNVEVNGLMYFGTKPVPLMD